MTQAHKIRTPKGSAVVVFELTELKALRSAVVVFSNMHVWHLDYWEQTLDTLVQDLIAGDTRVQRDNLDAIL